MRNFSELPQIFWRQCAEYTTPAEFAQLSATNKDAHNNFNSIWKITALRCAHNHQKPYIQMLDEFTPINWKTVTKIIRSASSYDKLKILYLLNEKNFAALDDFFASKHLSYTYFIENILKYVTDDKKSLEYLYNNYEKFCNPQPHRYEQDLSRLYWALLCKQPLATIIPLVTCNEDLRDRLLHSHHNALAIAINTGNIEAAEYFIKYDESILHFRPECEEIILMLAVAAQQEACIDLLLQQSSVGINEPYPDSRNPNERFNWYQQPQSRVLEPKGHFTALDFAAQIGNLRIFKMLQAQGAVSNSEVSGMTPLHIAAKYKHVELVEYLLNIEPDSVHRINSNGYTPLGLCLHNGWLDDTDNDEFDEINVRDILEIYRLLRTNGATFETPRDNRLLLSDLTLSHTEILSDMVNAGIPFDTRNERGRGVLHIATREGMSDVLKMFITLYLAQDPQWNVAQCRDNNNHTPIESVQFNNNNTNIIQLLIQYGDDPHKLSIRHRNKSSLYMSIYNHNNQVAELLISHNIDSANAFIYAIQCYNLYMIRRHLTNYNANDTEENTRIISDLTNSPENKERLLFCNNLCKYISELLKSNQTNEASAAALKATTALMGVLLFVDDIASLEKYHAILETLEDGKIWLQIQEVLIPYKPLSPACAP